MVRENGTLADDDKSPMATIPADCGMVIGLSFGNSNSSISFISKAGKAECIANETGDRQIPAALSYSVYGEEHHGAEARAQLVQDPQNTLVYFRDLLGKSFDNVDPKRFRLSSKPHPAGPDKDVPVFHISVDRKSRPDECHSEDIGPHPETEVLTPIDLTSRHLQRLKKSCEDYLGQPVSGAVISIPTNFHEASREALREAASRAQLSLLQLIHEPVAAALGYYADSIALNCKKDRYILVLDIGGVRSDCAILAFRGGMFTILASCHDEDFGGMLLDNALAEYLAKAFEKANPQLGNPATFPKALAKLHLAAEQAKKTFSASALANVNIESLLGGIDLRTSINRTRFNMLSQPFLQRCTDLALQTIRKASLDQIEIQEVLLCGGSCSLTSIERTMRDLFPDADIPTIANTSEVIALGAGIQANLVAGYELDQILESIHPVVTSAKHLHNSIGMKTANGSFLTLLEEESSLPCRSLHTFNTQGGNMLISLCEGIKSIKLSLLPSRPNGVKASDQDYEGSLDESDEDEEDEERREISIECGKVLGELALYGVRENAKVEVIVQCDKNGRVCVTARDMSPGGAVVKGTIDAPIQ